MTVVVAHAEKRGWQHQTVRNLLTNTQRQRMRGECIHAKRQVVTMAFAGTDRHDGRVVLAIAQRAGVQQFKLRSLGIRTMLSMHDGPS